MKGESFLTVNNISFSYPGSSTFRKGWTGAAGVNGSGKTTLLLLLTGALDLRSGSIAAPQPCVYCPQRTDAFSFGSEEFVSAVDMDAMRIRGFMRIDPDWFERLDTLSHGEHKRLQVGLALWKDPAAAILILIDMSALKADVK